MNYSRLLTFTLFVFAIPLAHADDSPKDVCKSAASLYSDGDLEGALEEARWCVTLMEQEQQANTGAYFRDEINGFKGDKLDQQNAMGFTVISRSYSKDNQHIDVSMNASTNGAAMGALSALANLGIHSGTGSKMRIQKRTAMVTEENGQVSINVSLRSGGMLLFESQDVDIDTLIAFAKAFPVAELDESKG